jgi:hypothetical protein
VAACGYRARVRPPAVVVASRVMFAVWRRSRRERIGFGEALARARSEHWENMTEEERRLAESILATRPRNRRTS